MLLLYRLIIWAILAFCGLNAAGVLHVPLQDPLMSWPGQFLYYLIGYLFFEIVIKWFGATKLKLSISPHIFLWLIVAFVHGIPGGMYGLFTQYSWYDQIAHFGLMGCFLMVLLFPMVRSLLGNHGCSTLLIVLAVSFCVTITLGVANEIVEYMFDLVSGSQMAAAPGDTANDLLMNTTGALLATCILLIRSKKD